MKRVLCVGDSNTAGAGVHPYQETQAWPALLEKMSEGNFEVLNYGLNAAALVETCALPYFKTNLSRRSFNTEPDVVLFMLGSNDTREENWDPYEYAEELKIWVSKYIELETAPIVYLMIPPPSFDYDLSKYKVNDSLIQDIRIIIPRVAEQLNIDFIDIYSKLEGKSELFPDTTHPNYEGNKIIAETVFEKIKHLIA